MSDSSGRFLRSATGALVVLALARPSAAQAPACARAESSNTGTPSSAWPAPLDREVSLKPGAVALREALDRVASLGKIRLSYSRELLPLDSIVCLSGAEHSVGELLSELLAGTGAAATPVGGNQVVLAPRAEDDARPAPDMASSVGMLDRVTVTGNAMGERDRATTVGMDVVSGKQLSRENVSTMSDALDGFVPGMWSWVQSPSTLLGSYASVRGASSFGLSYPKMYIDGVEVANPLLVTRFAPEAIDHIEVIRGPQGSALYGTDAISGVINIVTRHEGVGADEQHASLRTTAGVVASDYGGSVLTQSHAVSFAAGTNTRSADLNVSGGTVGAFIPNAYSRELVASASARTVGARSALSATARFFTQESGSASSPLVVRPAPSDPTVNLVRADSAPQSVRQYTIGTMATFTPNDRWTHTATVGIDGYQLANVQTNVTPIASIALQDSALRAAQGNARRGTVRVSSALHLGSENGDRQATLTFSAEHGVYQATLLSVPKLSAMGRTQVQRPATPTEQTTWQTSTGFTTQATASLDNTFFLTGGMRLERDSRLAGSQAAALPMIGAAAVHEYGPLTVKLRAAYGQGIRPPTEFGHVGLSQNARSVVTREPLGAERQSGTEAGFDVLLRDALTFRVTRFDQRASGLIQQVAVPADSNPASRRMRFDLENVGEIANRGWELETSANVSRLMVSGTLSFVSSRVEKVAAGYRGDLLAGDRMLQVPARTGSLRLSWLGNRWLTSLSASRALDWINYDELGLTNSYVNGTRTAHDLAGLRLREYWRQYNGGLRVRAVASRDIRDRVTFEVSGENLLDFQRNEPDNLTITPGRTLMTGVKVKF